MRLAFRSKIGAVNIASKNTELKVDRESGCDDAVQCVFRLAQRTQLIIQSTSLKQHAHHLPGK